LNAYDELVNRFGEDDTPAVREKVATGLINKGVALGNLERHEDALNAYDELVNRFGEDDTPAVREQVLDALNLKCNSLIQIWYRTKSTSIMNKALTAGRTCVAMGGKAYNLACVLVLSGEHDEAFLILEKSLNAGEIEWTFVEKDRDWADVRNDSRYLEMELKYKEKSGTDSDSR
jgi:tetratricopeptide (TPR) repeat protein